jgi:hypothetical protein
MRHQQSCEQNQQHGRVRDRFLYIQHEISNFLGLREADQNRNLAQNSVLKSASLARQPNLRGFDDQASFQLVLR